MSIKENKCLTIEGKRNRNVCSLKEILALSPLVEIALTREILFFYFLKRLLGAM